VLFFSTHGILVVAPLFPTGRSAWWPTSTTRRNSRTLRSRRSS
jgi:hypothetical protein